MKHIRKFNEHLPMDGWFQRGLSEARRWWNELTMDEQNRYCNEFFPEKCSEKNTKYFPNDKEIESMWIEVGEQCTTSTCFGGKVEEGKTFQDSRKKNPTKSWDADKKADFRLTIKNHVKSQGLKTNQVGNDLEIICDDEIIAQIMFRDTYVGVKRKNVKFTDEFKYDELGKIKSSISSVIKNCKK